MRNVSKKIKTHNFSSITPPARKRTIYETVWENILKRDWAIDNNKILRIRCEC